MTEIFEAVMMVLFGVSWPLSIYKSAKSRTSKGKSIIFLSRIWVGYVSGILSKIWSGNINYVFALYLLNILMVSADIALYFRNMRLDQRLEKDACA